MAYVAYTGLTTPNQVLEKMVEYVKSRGYTVIQDITDDLNIYDMSYSDGKRFCFLDRTGAYFIILRSANGTQIFGTNDDATMDITEPITSVKYTGIGMTVSEGYSTSKRWYNQYKVPKAKGTEAGKTVYGVYMPIKTITSWNINTHYGVDDFVEHNGTVYKCISSVSTDDIDISDTSHWVVSNSTFSYTLYCNNITSPSDTITFSLVKENDVFHQCTHLIFGNLHKFDTWTGGAIFSGSSIRSLMGNDVNVYLHERTTSGTTNTTLATTSDQYILPVLSSGTASNTFLRIDIDEAPTEIRGEILWACSGTANETGKKMSLPIRVGTGKNGIIPHYWYLQSHSRLDWGRNINTLNCITIDMPIFASVLVDPDVLDNYAAVGTVSGVYSVSMLNMQTAGIYEKSYPESNILDQVFPMGKRRGVYGFDGIAIAQQNDD